MARLGVAKGCAHESVYQELIERAVNGPASMGPGGRYRVVGDADTFDVDQVVIE